jgi:hypothetical protein
VTRAQLVDRLARRWGITRKGAGECIDDVLEAVLREVTPVVDREWVGNAVLARIRNLKSNPQSKE